VCWLLSSIFIFVATPKMVPVRGLVTPTRHRRAALAAARACTEPEAQHALPEYAADLAAADRGLEALPI
jgi:hypothetical protein